MNLNGRKILITGADGFIGSHLTEELVRKGHDVRALVLYNSFNSWGWLDHSPEDIKAGMEIVAGDIRDPHGIKDIVKDCDIVFHLASLIAIPYSYRSPASYAETNVTGTLNVLQAAREAETEKIIHTSTSEVYGTARFVPITEEHPLQGQSPYSASKIGADHMALSYHYSFNMPVSVIRPFNTYGPRQSARAIIPTIITQILAGKHEIKLGSLYPTRDFNYVKDIVRAFIAVAESDRSVGEVINIGSNHEISIGNLANLIAEVMDCEIEIKTEKMRMRPKKSEVDRLLADNSKAKELLYWQPVFKGKEGLIKGLSESINWFSDNKNIKKYKAGIYNI